MNGLNGDNAVGDERLSPESILTLRQALLLEAGKLLGVPYFCSVDEPERGKWLDLTKTPEQLDCSGFTEGIYHYVGLKIPHGSQNQFNATVALESGTEKPGDLVFMARERDITRIYHVGMLYDDKNIIECRAYDGRDWTGKVCLREKQYWEKFVNFGGYRSHAKLIY